MPTSCYAYNLSFGTLYIPKEIANELRNRWYKKHVEELFYFKLEKLDDGGYKVTDVVYMLEGSRHSLKIPGGINENSVKELLGKYSALGQEVIVVAHFHEFIEVFSPGDVEFSKVLKRLASKLGKQGSFLAIKPMKRRLKVREVPENYFEFRTYK